MTIKAFGPKPTAPVKPGAAQSDFAKDFGAVGKALQQVGDTFVNGIGAAIGYAEKLVGAGIPPLAPYQQKVSNGLTRGSGIDNPQGYADLEAGGFRSTIDLRAEGPGDAALGAKQAGLNTLRIPIIDNTVPTDGQMKELLDFATNPANQPVYIHCEAGWGRTGVAVACYRMAVQGWSPARALAEAEKDHLVMPDQKQFISQFGADLAAGKIAGYPLNPPLPS